MRDLRFTLMTTSGVRGFNEWCALLESARLSGFHAVATQDHVAGPELAPLIALASAAALQPRMDLATLVLNVDNRDLALLAQEIGTLCLLAPGRVEIGLGAGWLLADYTVRGRVLQPFNVRVKQIEEVVGLLRALLAGQSVSASGPKYRLVDYSLPTNLVPEKAPPILVGGGSRQLIELAAACADIAGLNPPLGSGRFDLAAVLDFDIAALERRIAWIETAAAGRVVKRQMGFFAFVVGEGWEHRAAALEAEHGLRDGWTASPFALVGSADEAAARVRELSRSYGITSFAVPDYGLRQFSAVIEQLSDSSS